MALAKINIQVEHTGQQFQVMFNPEEYNLDKDNNFASHSVPGLSSPLLQFVNGNLRTLELELFFDTYEEHRDVREETSKVVGLLDIDPDLHAPPVLRVTWASLDFRCVLARAGQRFTMFLDDGRPVRATLSVTFNEFVDVEREAKAVGRQTADYSKVHVVIEGETLSSIAAQFYQDSQLWRPIAQANRIADPRTIRPGQSLQVPSLPFVDRDTGEEIA